MLNLQSALNRGALWQRPQRTMLIKPLSKKGVSHSKNKKLHEGLTEWNSAPQPIYWRKVVCYDKWCANINFRAKLLLLLSKRMLVSVYHRHICVTLAIFQIAHC